VHARVDTSATLLAEIFERLGLELEVGMTHINDWPINDEPNTAFGGEKASGSSGLVANGRSTSSPRTTESRCKASGTRIRSRGLGP
jgi:acyl-CoA reductase-like NAD-dependent aldehyde dehydrogenase